MCVRHGAKQSFHGASVGRLLFREDMRSNACPLALDILWSVCPQVQNSIKPAGEHETAAEGVGQKGCMRLVADVRSR